MNHPILIALILLVLFFGGGSYAYGRGGEYPYRAYALPGVGTIIIVLIILYVLHII